MFYTHYSALIKLFGFGGVTACVCCYGFEPHHVIFLYIGTMLIGLLCEPEKGER